MAVFTSAAFAMRKKLILGALEKSGANSPETAKTLEEAGVPNPDMFEEYTEKLVFLEIIRKTEDGKFFID
jgi:hypothetical protein